MRREIVCSARSDAFGFMLGFALGFCSLLGYLFSSAMLVRDGIETTNKREFGIEQINGQKQLQTSTLVVYGDPSSYSAMAAHIF